jgi:hypothetical protein
MNSIFDNPSKGKFGGEVTLPAFHNVNLTFSMPNATFFVPGYLSSEDINIVSR